MMITEYYCRGCERVVPSNTVGERLGYLRHVRECGGCGFRVDERERIKDDLNQRFMSKVGKALEEAQREVERLQLENVQLKADLVQLRSELSLEQYRTEEQIRDKHRILRAYNDRDRELQAPKYACHNCGYPTHSATMLDKPEAFYGC